MKTLNKILMAVLMTAFMCASAKPSAALQRVEDDNFSVTSMLPTQYVLYTLTGSTGATSVYYKVTAVVNGGVGEIKPANLTVADANAVRSSTNTLLIRWAPVIGTVSYNVYRSTVSSSTYFYLLGNVDRDTHSLLDYGQAAGAAYSAPDPRGGNLEVENDVTIGGAGKITLITKAAIEAKTPSQAGEFYGCSNCIDSAVCISTGTGISAWVQISSITAACN